MKPAVGTDTPGTSINFDAQAIHDAEEAEYQQEEQDRQNELRQLLTSAFDDDLSDEESVMSQDNDVSRLSHDQGVPTIQQDPGNEWASLTAWPQHMYVQTSTPAVTGQAPPLQTPGIGQYMLGYYGNMVGPGAMMTPFQVNAPDETLKYNEISDWPVTFTPGGATDCGERGEIEGANDDDVRYTHEPASYATPGTYQNTAGVYYGHDHFDTVPGQQYGANVNGGGTPALDNGGQPPELTIPTEKTPPQYHWSPGNDGDGDTEYHVRYVGGRAVEKAPSGSHQRGDVPLDASRDHVAAVTPVDGVARISHEDQLQRKFLEQGGSTDSRQLAQLQMLYDARGHRLEEMTAELKRVTEDGDREIRILHHKLGLKQDERDGMATSLENTKLLLSETKQRESEVTCRVASLEKQLQTLTAANQELKAKLQTTESTIEGLSVQLMSLGENDTLTHTREQHSAFVVSLQQKHENEILRLNEMIDQSKRAINEKDDEVGHLRRQVAELLKASELAQLDRADTINRLTQSVEESQRQCQQLLETGNSHDASRMRIHLQEAIAGKSIADDLNSSLQAEIRELKEQIQMYESASQFLPGAAPNPLNPLAPPAFDDSYMQLGIKTSSSPLTQSPASRASTPSLSTEQTLASLRTELERCLGMYRGKRSQVTALTSDLQGAKTQLGAVTDKLECLQREMAQIKERRDVNGQLTVDAGDMKLQQDLGRVTGENKALVKQLQETIDELESVRVRESRLSEQQQELSRQMASMVREYDEDKREALERCHKTVMQHHEHTKQILRDELQVQFTADVDQQLAAHAQETQQARVESEAAQSEVMEVKQLYMEMCQQKDNLEAELRTERENLDRVIQEARAVGAREREEFCEEALREARTRWETEVEGIVSKRLEEARQLWQTESSKTLEATLRSRLQAEKETWHSSELQEALTEQKLRLETQMQEDFTKEKEVWLTTTIKDALAKEKEIWLRGDEFKALLAMEKETWLKTELLVKEKEMPLGIEVKELLAREKESWLATELTEALTREKQVWLDAELPVAVEKARLAWQDDVLRTALSDARDMWEADQLPQAVEAAREEWRDTELKGVVSGVEERCRAQLEAATHEARLQGAAQVVAETKQRIEEQTDGIACLKTKLETADRERDAAEEELSSRVTQHQLLMKRKDSERQKAIQELRDECERDYKQFVADHGDTLSSALRAARHEFSNEKASLVKTHQAELKRMRDAHSESMQKNKDWQQDKTELERCWQEKLEAASGQCRVEKDALEQSYRVSLTKALDDARNRWNNKDVSAVDQQVAALVAKERGWEAERREFLSELRQRDELLERADCHLEAEVAKLHSQLNEEHAANLDRDLAKLRAQLDDSYSQHVQSLGEDNRELQTQLGTVSGRLTELESSHGSLVATLTASLKEKNAAMLSQQEADRARLRDMEGQLEGERRERQEAVDERGAVEKEFAAAVEAHQQRQSSLSDKIRKLEKCIKYMDSKSRKTLAATTALLEREHGDAINTMTEKMVELRQGHAVSLEAVRREGEERERGLREELEAVVNQGKRQMAGSPTQATSEPAELTALQSLHQQYLEAINRIREDVLRHVRDSGERAAHRVRSEMLKEREMTARRLRRHYIKSLSQLLEKEYHCSSKQQKLAAIEHALNNLPLGSSTSTTPMTSVDNTPETTPRDVARSRSSRNEQCATPDGLDSARYRDVQSRTLDDLDSVMRAEIPARTTIAIPITRREPRSNTPDELAYAATHIPVNCGTPDDLDFVIHGGPRSRTPDDIDSMIRANLRSTTPDERYPARDRGRRCVTDDVNVVRRTERSCVTPDDLDSDRISATRSGSGPECVDSDASRLQRTKSLSSLLHSSIASWELTNKAVLDRQPAGEATTGPDRMYFQSRADVPSETSACRDVSENITSRTEGHYSNRDRPGKSASTDVVGTHLNMNNKSRGTAHALDDCVTDRYVARQQTTRSAALNSGTSTASGSIYRYTPLRKAATTNVTRSAGALSTSSKSVSHLLGDTDAHASATCFLSLDEKPRRYNPPAERLDSASNRGQTTRSATLSASPDLVRHSTITAPLRTARSEDNRGGNTRSFLPVGGAARPSRQDAQLCHPTAVSRHHGGGDTAPDRELKPRHVQVPSTPPVKLYHIDNV